MLFPLDLLCSNQILRFISFCPFLNGIFLKACVHYRSIINLLTMQWDDRILATFPLPKRSHHLWAIISLFICTRRQDPPLPNMCLASNWRSWFSLSWSNSLAIEFQTDFIVWEIKIRSTRSTRLYAAFPLSSHHLSVSFKSHSHCRKKCHGKWSFLPEFSFATKLGCSQH